MTILSVFVFMKLVKIMPFFCAPFHFSIDLKQSLLVLHPVYNIMIQSETRSKYLQRNPSGTKGEPSLIKGENMPLHHQTNSNAIYIGQIFFFFEKRINVKVDA